MSLRSRLTAALAGSLVVTALGAPWVVPAHAATGVAPVTVADTVEVDRGAPTFVDVLDNDTDADGEDLTVCRLGKVPRGLQVEVLDDEAGDFGRRGGRRDAGELFVLADTKPGTYEITYYACDFSFLTVGTLTVVVAEQPRIRVRVEKLDRPGRLKVTNRSGFRVQFVWGSLTASEADGTITVGRKPKTIDVRRTSIVWGAASSRTSDFRIGVVRDIRPPRGVKALPPGAPDGPLPDLDGAAAFDAGGWPSSR